MSDLISRQAAIDAYGDWYVEEGTLVTRKSKYIGNYTDMAVCEKKKKNGMWTHEDWDAIVLGDVKDGKSTGLISTRDDDIIIAWMPLPEPYKERRTDD